MKNIKHVLPRSRFAADTKLTNNAVIAGAAERATPACSAGRRVWSRHRLRVDHPFGLLANDAWTAPVRNAGVARLRALREN